jgi:hypothetical protein
MSCLVCFRQGCARESVALARVVPIYNSGFLATPGDAGRDVPECALWLISVAGCVDGAVHEPHFEGIDCFFQR